MTFKDAWDVLQKSVESTHKLWAYFATISLAVTGYVVGWDKIDWSGKMYLAVSLGYFLFAFGNRRMLWSAQKEVVGVSELVKAVQLDLPDGAPEKS
jgi:hypothetical protein